jgi:hypothetical protein
MKTGSREPVDKGVLTRGIKLQPSPAVPVPGFLPRVSAHCGYTVPTITALAFGKRGRSGNCEDELEFQETPISGDGFTK